jgi:predicted O-methyltransferase YrrM
MAQRSNLPFLWERAEAAGMSTTSEFDLNSIDSWGRVVSAYDAPSQSEHHERLLLYALVLGRRPQRALEIGFRFGGTSFVILCAMEDAKVGRLVSIDPEPEPLLDFSRFDHRFTLLQGNSPSDVPRAVEILGGPLDFCFIDGNHAYANVLADLKAIAPHMSPDSYVVLHDAVYPEVARATNDFVKSSKGRVVDCGNIAPTGTAAGWGGLRMLRFPGRS